MAGFGEVRNFSPVVWLLSLFFFRFRKKPRDFLKMGPPLLQGVESYK